MRFLPGGPWIPDALLSARDAGEVLFFCGAGVSRAKAGLPDFVTLAMQVADALGATQQGDARRLLRAAIPAEDGTKPVGSVAIDRVFTLLQQEFEIADVRRVVAVRLSTPANCDLAPHRTLLKLSQVRGGQPRLVTTNFDLLFEQAEVGIQSSAPPRLPDPRRPQDFHGVVHLHGAVNATFNGAEHDEFVLSSGEFGHAYLSDGWATRYIQALLERFIIVFVGYSADDPPVQYLLEAMNRGAAGTPRLYAFHLGTAQEAVAQWSHRGVTPIPFDTYSALWDSLDAWAKRACDLDAWHRSIIALAAKGPASLAPHERSLVSHLARSTEGARVLATAEVTAPAEWLFVFDRALRYKPPSRWGAGSDSLDPFEVLGLDDDPPPERVEVENPAARRTTPVEAWDAFEIATEDRASALSDAFATLTGPGAAVAGVLPPRLSHLARWISRVADQPASVAWMAGRQALHPHLRRLITWRLRHQPAEFSEDVREAWTLLMASEDIDNGPLRHAIGAEVARVGWSSRSVRAAAALYRPHIVVRQGSAMPWSELHPEVSLTSLMRAEVEYPRPYAPFEFPADLLCLVCRLFRGHLELAVQLEEEMRGSGALYFDAIRPLEGEGRSEFRLTGLMGTFAGLVESLAVADASAAKREVEAWKGYDDAAFTHLRIWAAGFVDMMGADEAAETLLGVNAEVFWSSDHERDLMLTMRDRWDDWALDQRMSFERRLLEEPLPWFAGRDDRDEIIAHYRLNRLQWLKEQGVAVSFDESEVMARLKTQSPSWEEAAAQQTAQPRVTRVRGLRDDPDDSPLAVVPLGDVVAAAHHLSGYDFGQGTVRNPFAGLAQHYPARALRSLVLATRQGIETAAAWSTFLQRQIQSTPSDRLRAQVTRRLSRLPVATTLAIAHPLVDWMASQSEHLTSREPAALEALWAHILAVLDAEAPEARSGRIGWVNDAINRPVGKLVELMFRDPRIKGWRLEADVDEDWLRRIDVLLQLPEPRGFQALSLVALRFAWLSWLAPAWTEARLVPWAADEGAGGDALWSGILTEGQVPSATFFMQLKSSLLRRAVDEKVGRTFQRTMAGMLLIGWRGIDRHLSVTQQVTDVELREALILGDDELRRGTLWQLGYWAKNEEEADGYAWDDHVLPFLDRVWPLQRSVRTGASSSALLNLAFDVPERWFDAVVTAIAPRLTEVDTGAMMGILDEAGIPGFVRGHALALLTLLWAVLAEDAARWPYGADVYLQHLSSHADVADDPRLIELQRRRHRAGPL
ncbi:SIR2 family protein [Luteibacter sahnii]|uniref:SIR2 family protein n=1 Tax=Luteibacter sahnii TaxID=3021977 RepID=UPI002A69F2DF|nr:SIR2 family protein [Luteibacter sp. PPL193]MDY1548033.1 SIR2 family protein [Luteibacter sp. PPL193]